MRNITAPRKNIRYQTAMVSEYRSAFKRSRASGNLSVAELEYLSKAYKNLLAQSLDNLDQLALVITANKMRMSDQECLTAIDRIFSGTEDMLQFLRSFNQSTGLLGLQREREKVDGAYNVKICVHHKDQRKFIDTNHYVVKKQLTAKLKIKDNFVNDLIDDQLKGYRKIISELDEKLNFFNAESLRDYLRDKDADVDFIKFCQLHIEQLKKENRTGTAGTHSPV